MIEIKRQEIEEIKPIEKLQRILQIFDVEIRLLVLESLMCKGGSEIGLYPKSELESESERTRESRQKDLNLLFITIPNTCTWRLDFWRKYVRPLLLPLRDAAVLTFGV